jgi:hypothetical protein
MRFALLTTISILTIAAPSFAGEPTTPVAQETIKTATSSDKPIPQTSDKTLPRDRVTASDVAATPLTDMNLRKAEIPAALLAAGEAPYSIAGMSNCQRLSTGISQLDSALGEDVDIASSRGKKINVGQVAQDAVGNFIPFRGIIRQISGANEQQRKMQVAIYAGTARRGFLKGLAIARGCHYQSLAGIDAANLGSKVANTGRVGSAAATAHPRPRMTHSAYRSAKRTNYVSKPVVQRTN